MARVWTLLSAPDGPIVRGSRAEEGRQLEAVTILISHSQEDSDHFEDVLPAVPVVMKMQMDVSF